MSNFSKASGEDYPDAARKNFIDSKSLMNRRRYDGAAYLSGYVIECIFKTLMLVDGGVPRFIHDLNQLSTEAQRLFLLPASRTSRYFSSFPLSTISYNNPPLGWNETLRYYKEGTIPRNTAASWFSEAGRLYRNCLGKLIKDGVVIL
jgi:hypothetical protein